MVARQVKYSSTQQAMSCKWNTATTTTFLGLWGKKHLIGRCVTKYKILPFPSNHDLIGVMEQEGPSDLRCRRRREERRFSIRVW